MDGVGSQSVKAKKKLKEKIENKKTQTRKSIVKY